MHGAACHGPQLQHVALRDHGGRSVQRLGCFLGAQRGGGERALPMELLLLLLQPVPHKGLLLLLEMLLLQLQLQGGQQRRARLGGTRVEVTRKHRRKVQGAPHRQQLLAPLPSPPHSKCYRCVTLARINYGLTGWSFNCLKRPCASPSAACRRSMCFTVDAQYLRGRPVVGRSHR